MNEPAASSLSSQEAPGSTPEHALSVAELNRSARQLLEKQIPSCWIEGEVSSLSRPASGHAYFTLKDDKAQVRCALFRQQGRFVAAPLKEGALIQVRAQISLYEPRGDYQLIVEAVRAVGHGALLQALAALRERLAAEGVFANARPLPYPPRHLGLITSATGAAIRDVIAVLSARWPSLEVTLLPVPVQGQQAPEAIVAALMAANRDPRFDALLLTRGGGSFEDLNVFNDERIVRALYGSRIPVLSAIGHEIDTTLADLAADAAAPTPSAAAERLTPDQRDVRRRLVQLAHRLLNAQRHGIQTARQQLDYLALRLRQPDQQLAQYQQQLTRWVQRLHQAEQAQRTHFKQRLALLTLRLRDPRTALSEQRQRFQTLRQRLENAQRYRLSERYQRWQRLEERLRYQQRHLSTLSFQRQLQGLQSRLTHAQQRRLDQATQRFSLLLQRLESISPLNTLKRGYAVVRNAQQRVIGAVDQVERGERLSITLQQGTLQVEVVDDKA